MKLIIQIPCYNEEQTLAATLAELPEHIDGVDEIEVLIIDDGSTDRTLEVARENGVTHICQHKSNQGLGRAFRNGLELALKEGADVIVNTDGDGQYCGRDIAVLVQPVLAGEADIVVGDRNTAANTEFSFLKRRLQWLGSHVVRSLSGTNIPDAVSGFRAISRGAALQLNIISRFTYTVEMLIQAGNRDMTVTSVPVRTNPKTRESRLFRNVPEFIARQLVGMIRMYAMYRPMRLFFYIGTVLCLLGSLPVMRFLYHYFRDGGAGYIQSLMLGGSLLTIGFIVFVTGLLSDLISQNRQLNEMSLQRIREMELREISRSRAVEESKSELSGE